MTTGYRDGEIIMDKFMSHRDTDGTYNLFIYHPTYIKVIPYTVGKKVLWFVGRKINGNWKIATNKPFPSKAAAMTAAKIYLENTIQDTPRQAPKQSPQKQLPQASSNMSRGEALKVLGLPDAATEADIKNAFKKFLAVVHPDRGGSNFLMLQINLAREVLMK